MFAKLQKQTINLVQSEGFYTQKQDFAKTVKITALGILICIAGNHSSVILENQKQAEARQISPQLTRKVASAMEITPQEKEIKLDKDKLAKIQTYLEAYTPNSPISPELILRVAEQEKFPVSFLLVSGTLESHLGTYGRAVATKNVFNVGNTDCGDKKQANKIDGCSVFEDEWEKGFLSFTTLIKNCYFEENEKISLEKFIARDFRAVRCPQKGARYMTDKNATNQYTEYNAIIKQYEITF